MSFNSTKRRAQDSNRHINSRRVSVRSCIQLCTHYSGLNTYQSINAYYNKTEQLNSEGLTSENIERILSELTELRQQSKLLRQEYNDYRNKQKQQGKRAISKKEEAIWKEYLSRINQLWDKFNTSENRNKKALLYAARRKEAEALMERWKKKG
jgi:hypothetical protein